MSVTMRPYRPPCLICRRPTIPSVASGAPSQLCDECKSRPVDPEPKTEWRRVRQAERRKRGMER